VLHRILSLAGGMLLLGASSAAALGINASAASVGTLSPGATATSAVSPVTVTGLATDAWALRVTDAATGATAGHMVRSGACTLGVASLANPLHLATSRTLATTTIDRPSYDLASAANPVIAHGSTPDVVNITYSQAVGAAESLATGCTYSVTLTFTVASS